MNTENRRRYDRSPTPRTGRENTYQHSHTKHRATDRPSYGKSPLKPRNQNHYASNANSTMTKSITKSSYGGGYKRSSYKQSSQKENTMESRISEAERKRLFYQLNFSTRSNGETQQVKHSRIAQVQREPPNHKKAAKMHRPSVQALHSLSKVPSLAYEIGGKTGVSFTDVENMFGPYEYENGKVTYFGQFSGGKIFGIGAFVDSEGHVYEGELRNGRKHGWGRCCYPNGNYYIGEWREGKPHGNGTHGWRDGGLYEGQWRDGKMNGKGKETNRDKSWYEGSWRDGLKSGQGKFVWPNGDVYNGSWREGLRDGRGEFDWANGSHYVGSYKKNEMHGRGKLAWNDGTIYEGEFDQGRKTGRGKFTWPSGNYYQGEFLDGKRHGKGRIVQTDGKKIEGHWENDQFCDLISSNVEAAKNLRKSSRR